MGGNYALYLMTGATGYLGKVIVNRLVAEGKRVRALILPGDLSEPALPPAVERVFGGLDDDAALHALFAGDVRDACLIHCAGVISIASRINKALYEINVEGTRRIFDLCLQYRPAFALYVSSVHAIPEKPTGQVMTETDVFSPDKVRGQYAKSKAIATQYVLDMANKGLAAGIVHPSGIIGPYDSGRGNIAATIIAFCRRKLPLAVSGGYDFVDVRDVADGILACCEQGKPGACYILSGHYARLQEIFECLSKMGCGKEPRYLPLWLVKALSPFMELASIVHKRPFFLTPYSAYTLGCNALFSHEKATRELAYHPRDLDTTLRDMVEWLREQNLIPLPDEQGV